GLPPGNMVDFEGAGVGACLVWGLSYTGNILVSVGDNALTSQLSDDCFELSSNFITVERNDDCVTGFTLINADTDTDIGPIQDGDVIDLKVLGTNDLTLRAEVLGNDIESVRFWFNGNSNHRTENESPYAFNGDNGNGDFYPYQFVPGTYTVRATPYSMNNAQGDQGTPAMITFTVISTPDMITEFILVNANSNQDIGPIEDGDVIDLSVVGTNQLSIRAMTNPSPVGSVLFGLNGTANFQTENNMPYALNGDNNGNYNPVTFHPGSYTVTATPFSQRSRKGDQGQAKTIQFTVVGGSSSGLLANTPILGTFPNPASTEVTVELSNVESGKLEMTVVNLMGSVVYRSSESVNVGPWRQQVSLRDLPAGVYMITIQNGSFHDTQRIIKE
ncbi:MAG: T9SS type A sorting domain-containing protein, partial [Bacteroidia bacterium]|nr:T9SS type A sorting domain-containing protein [Bacteroidia bacterium]